MLKVDRRNTKSTARLRWKKGPPVHAGRYRQFPRYFGSIFEVIGWISMCIQAVTWAGSLTLVGLVVSACASHPTSPSATRSGAPWAQDLNEPPPGRDSISEPVPRIKADLNAARDKASR
jgi:hypothetical protein